MRVNELIADYERARICLIELEAAVSAYLKGTQPAADDYPNMKDKKRMKRGAMREQARKARDFLAGNI
jgi:hypothetical protein